MSASEARPPARRTPALVPLLSLLAPLALGSGCAANHAFVQEAPLDVPSLVEELDAKRAQEDEEEALFDLTYIPLVHLDLQAFAEQDEEDYPEGHAYVEVRSWLPLFGIVDGEVRFFDVDHERYERDEFISVLWGMWSRVRTTVKTVHGDRTESRYGLLWLLDLDGNVRYVPGSVGM